MCFEFERKGKYILCFTFSEKYEFKGLYEPFELLSHQTSFKEWLHLEADKIFAHKFSMHKLYRDTYTYVQMTPWRKVLLRE
jgi:hypothetical protein